MLIFFCSLASLLELNMSVPIAQRERHKSKLVPLPSNTLDRVAAVHHPIKKKHNKTPVDFSHQSLMIVLGHLSGERRGRCRRCCWRRGRAHTWRSGGGYVAGGRRLTGDGAAASAAAAIRLNAVRLVGGRQKLGAVPFPLPTRSECFQHSLHPLLKPIGE
jgi:hypothetical protein